MQCVWEPKHVRCSDTAFEKRLVFFGAVAIPATALQNFLSSPHPCRKKRSPDPLCHLWQVRPEQFRCESLATMLDGLNPVAFVSLDDCTTPAGKLQLHILAALAEFERERIRERVVAGLQRAKSQGKHLERPRARPPQTPVPWRNGASGCGCLGCVEEHGCPLD
jgi:hypothetical protein